MVLGIVGSEAAKFTPVTEENARIEIRATIQRWCMGPLDMVVSGACHLGGIDLWAIEEAKNLGVDTREFPPKVRQWEGGYKQRNIEIAKISDLVVCITLRNYPDTYTGGRFGICYHCNSQDHVKSGGCWTAKYCRSLGKESQIIVID